MESIQRATVQVVVESDDGNTFTGSGSIVSPKGYILTNAHVVYDLENGYYYDSSGEAVIHVTTDPRQPASPQYLARVVQLDPEADLAVLKVTTHYDGRRLPKRHKFEHTMQLSDSDKVKLGDPILVFGFPGVGGDSVTFTRGVVSGFVSDSGMSIIKTDAQFTHGSSGGAATDERGRLIGVPTWGIVDDAGRVGYLVPSSSARPLIVQALNGDEIAIRNSPTNADTSPASDDSPPEGSPGGTMMYVDAAPHGYPDGAFIRAEPNRESEVYIELPNGTPIEVIGEAFAGGDGEDWYKVRYETYTGYTRAKLLSLTDPGPNETSPATTTMYVDAAPHGYPDGAFIRAEPNRESEVFIEVPNGTAIEVLGEPFAGGNGEDWYKVSFQTHIGYTRAKLLSPTNPDSIGTSPATTMYVDAEPHGYPDGAFIRAEPNRESEVYIELPNGTPIEVIGAPVAGGNGEDWYKVTYETYTGYTRAKLLSDSPPGSASGPVDNVTFKVYGTATDVDIEYDNPSGGRTEVLERSLPWSQAFQFEPDSWVEIYASSNSDAHRTLTCEIWVNGTLVDQTKSSETYPYVSCWYFP